MTEPLPSIFDLEGAEALEARIDRLTSDAQAAWGTMNAAQMMAHNSLVFEGARFDNYPTMNPVMRWIVNKMIRGMVVGDKPYRKNSRTAPAWNVADDRDFDVEKARLVENIRAVHGMGRAHFEGKSNPTFGTLSADEWSRVFCKHLDYHLEQFGV